MSRKESLNAQLAAAEEVYGKAMDRCKVAFAKVEGIKAQLVGIEAIEALTVGDSCYITVGRADTRAEVAAVIEAVKAGETEADPRVFKLKYTRTGDDFDAEYTVQTEAQVRLQPTPVEAAE